VECTNRSDNSKIIGATGTICESFGKYLSNTPEKHDFKELQKKNSLSQVVI
jgi:hypothetical protein